MIKKVPVPTAGVMLGLAALGNLLAPYSMAARYACGVGAAFLGLLLLAKIILYPQVMKNDLSGNSIFGSVFATFFMSVMQLCTYVQPFAPIMSEAVWFGAVAAHFLLMIWFTNRYILNFKLTEVFPTYFIAYVGIVVASVTAPVFGLQKLGEYIFWFGFAAYAVMFVLVTVRYVKHEVPEPAKPLFCIYSAPMSLSLAGYLACVEQKSALMVIVMEILAQCLFAAVLTQMPKLLRLPFYPSYAAFTFPFVITAIALRGSLAYLRDAGMALPAGLDGLVLAETAAAAAIVLYVFARYMKFFSGLFSAEAERKTKSVPVIND